MEEAWAKGLYHRIVRIVVEDSDGRLLLQKRAPTKELYPDFWDSAASGHVDAGEDYETAAKRELKEELGVNVTVLEELERYRSNRETDGRKLNRFSITYRVIVPPNSPVTIDEKELAEARWFTIQEINQILDDNSAKITNGLRRVIERFYQHADQRD